MSFGGFGLTTTRSLANTATAKPETDGSESWRGLVVAPEDRCSPYDSDDYRYSQSVEQRIVTSMGGIVYGPYTGRWFDNTSETDIEHIVARSEAHDSGLCDASAETRRRFATDLLNLTLASPEVNRSQKSGKDASEWLPELNRCWFSSRNSGKASGVRYEQLRTPFGDSSTRVDLRGRVDGLWCPYD